MYDYIIFYFKNMIMDLDIKIFLEIFWKIVLGLIEIREDNL